MPRTSVEEVLAAFDAEFAEFAAAFARGEYLLWLGSGISRNVVPGVPELLERMIEFLRINSNLTDPTCRYKKALDEVLDVAAVPAKARAAIDFATPISGWPGREDLINRLVDRYSDVLDVQVDGEPEDFLVWIGLDVPNTYGAPGLLPDVEHYCVAILMLEGVVRSAPTTNWDGLVEAAMERLVPNVDELLTVIVRPADFATIDRQAELVKFHGCAVRAVADAAGYRDLLIARRSQISGWTTKPQNQMMKNHLEHLFASRPAFIVGLSAQDANIHIVLHEASQNLAREWPASPAAVVFAEQQLHHHHRLVMRVTYGDSYTINAAAIQESALLGAFAKQALLATVLYTLADKLCALTECVPELSLPPAEMSRVCVDIRSLRDAVGRFADVDPRSFIDTAVALMSFALLVFRTGTASYPGGASYQPISVAPIAKARQAPDFPGGALGRLAVAVSLISRGLNEGLWTVEPGTSVNPSNGVLRLSNGHQQARVFLVRDARAMSQLELNGVVDPDDSQVLVLQAEAQLPPATRSPRAHYGRTGRTGARCVDLEQLCGSASTADELLETFKLEGAL